MKWFRRKKGQNVAEYAILIALVVGAIIAMQKFAQRGLQARIHGATNYMVQQDSNVLGNTAQYVPYYEQSAYDSVKNETERKGGNADSESFALDSASSRLLGGSTNATYNAEETVGNGMSF